ncbi:hypothetical protein OGAPHI_002151 [Ogataea philodendri]|uniref:Uncharacterized protein n=1 Tax=Ogataea philodendri TaxID=1378263 RepID=A0A9P8PBQ9_9ASCO|nr:uncharacterized protein OGAPHI_002151 [Ogataea philodendri]KAH3668397.1 hypothetical protein OGAPHI_002151 [Ogataea philodendri]
MDTSDGPPDQGSDHDKMTCRESGSGSQILTPKLNPTQLPKPSTPPNQGRSCNSADSSEITAISLSSPPLTPPPRVIRRLTPLGKFSPRKSASSIDDDIQSHTTRRLQQLDKRVGKTLSHSDVVSANLTSLEQQKVKKRELLLEKLNRAVKNKEEYINHKKLVATSTVRSICSSKSSDDTESLEMYIAQEKPAQESVFAFPETFKIVDSMSLWANLQRLPMFANFEEAVVKTDIENTYKFINSREIIKTTALLFEEMKLFNGTLDKFLLARCFLFGFSVLVEKTKFEKFKRKPMYDIRLNTKQDFFSRLIKDFPNLKQHHLDDTYYNFLIDELHQTTFSIWKQFQRLVHLNGSEFEKYAFKEQYVSKYYPIFQVFKFNHWFRTLAMLSESNDGLTKHLNFLRTMRSITPDNDVLVNEYKHMIRKGEAFIKINKERFRKLKADNRAVDMATVDQYEQEYVAKHKATVLSGSLTDDNPLISVSSTSKSNFKSTASRPVSLVPPTFSVDNWRKYLFKVMLDYRSRDVHVRLKTGKVSRFFQDASTSTISEPDRLGEYIEEVQPDIEAIRTWLGLKSYNEGCIEAIERLSYVDTIELMMVDIVQMVERCLYAMFIVMEDSSKTVNLVFPDNATHRRENSNVISFLSDSVLVLNKLHNGLISLQEYFEMSLTVLRREIPDFLRYEAETLLTMLGSIDKLFVQKFVEFIKDCMIYGMNNCIKNCLKFIGSNIVEFEREVFECNYPSAKVSLNLRYPNLYKLMQMHKELIMQPDDGTPETRSYLFFNRLFTSFLCSTNSAKVYEMPEFLDTFSIQFLDLNNQVRSLITLQSISVILMSSLANTPTVLPPQLANSSFAAKSQQQLIDFPKLLADLDNFMLSYFDQIECNRFNNFFKEEVYRILCMNVGERLSLSGYEKKAIDQVLELNLDQKHIGGLIAQIEKVNIGSTKVNSLKTIYVNAMASIISAEVGNHGRMYRDEKYLRQSAGMFARLSSSEVENKLTEELQRAYSKFYGIDLVQDRIHAIVKNYYLLFDLCVEVHQETMCQVVREFDEICTFERTAFG